MQSTSGINRFKSNKYKFAIIFDNNTCPYCGNRMNIDIMRLKGIDIKTRFICHGCGLVLPIDHTSNNKILPLYDSRVYSFLTNFGQNINDKKLKNI